MDGIRPEDNIGTILTDHALEHVIAPEQLIRKVTKISKPGTCLIISVPNDFFIIQLKLLEQGYIETPFWVITTYPPEHGGVDGELSH